MRDPLKADLCSTYLRAVAEPDRLRIIQCLRSGPKSVSAICENLGTGIANVSHHLKFLRNAGLVTAKKQGRFVIYSLASKFARASSDGSLDSLDFGCCRIELSHT
jgi:ArsR family transcriptional regulator